MNEEAIDRLLDALEPLAEKLGEGARALWEIAIRQVIAEAIVYSILAVVFLVAVVASVRVCKLTWRKGEAAKEASDRRYSSDGEGWYVSCILSGIVGAACFGASLAWAAAALMRFVNPNFYAFRLVMDQIR